MIFTLKVRLLVNVLPEKRENGRYCDCLYPAAKQSGEVQSLEMRFILSWERG